MLYTHRETDETSINKTPYELINVYLQMFFLKNKTKQQHVYLFFYAVKYKVQKTIKIPSPQQQEPQCNNYYLFMLQKDKWTC